MAKATIALPMGIFGKQTDLLVEKGALKKKKTKPSFHGLDRVSASSALTSRHLQRKPWMPALGEIPGTALHHSLVVLVASGAQNTRLPWFGALNLAEPLHKPFRQNTRQALRVSDFDLAKLRRPAELKGP